MRQETSKIMQAFMERRRASAARTMTDGNVVWLHHRAIVRRPQEGGLEWTLAGYNTLTTRERLNGLFETLSVPLSVVQRQFEPYLLNHKTKELTPIDPRSWYALF